jgi:DNA-binding MarR family transcriptional regulator
MSSFDPQHRQNNVAGHATVTLYRISQAIALLLRDKGQRHGLSPTQVQALLFLAYARPNARTIGGLAERLGCTSATASGVADALERKGLVIREPWPQNRRTVMLRLTANGAAMAATVDNGLEELETVVRELSEAELAALLRAARHIEWGLAEHGWIKMYESCWKCHMFRPDEHPNDPSRPHHCAFMDVPVQDADTYTECAYAVPLGELVQ